MRFNFAVRQIEPRYATLWRPNDLIYARYYRYERLHAADDWADK